MFGKIMRFGLLKRFIQSMREEGLRAALRKTKIYLGMILRGGGRSVFGSGAMDQRNADVGDAIQSDSQYLNNLWQSLARGQAFHITQAPAVHMRQRRIALIGDLNLPQCRKYRVEQVAEFWRAQGVECVYAHYQDVPRCVHALQSASHLMEYRLQVGPVTSMYRYEARRLRLPILYDIDDPLFSVSAYETYKNMEALDPGLKAHFLAEAPKYLDMMNGADILSLSTQGLVEHASLYSPRPAYLRRNFADETTLQAGAAAVQARGDKGQDDIFRVAFASGSQGHEVDFEILQDQVISFLAGNPNRRLMILGHFDLSRLPKDLQAQVETHPFTTYEAYLQHLSLADCAVMPLENDIFNHCKSAVRVIDASAVGVPSIVGRVGDMKNMVLDGTTGLIVENDAAWEDALLAISKTPKTSLRMGQKARKKLESHWAGQPKPHIIAPELLDWVLK